jgi:phage shock protein C
LTFRCKIIYIRHPNSQTMKQVQYFLESQAFGVCTKLGEKLGFATSSIRLSFIYLSFLTFGSPVIVYLIMAFWLNVRKHLRRERSTVWDV